MDGVLSDEAVALTAKPRRDEVLELVARRRSLKQIAFELNISESTVNYHIKNLKDLHGVNTLAQLTDVFANVSSKDGDLVERFSARRESAVFFAQRSGSSPSLDNAEPAITFHDALQFNLDAPWIETREPRVVPEVLDGTNAGLMRSATIVAIALGMLALVLLGLGVAQGITAALSGFGASSA